MMIFTVHQFLRKQELSQIIVKFGLVMILECGVQLDYSNSLDHITTLLQKKIMPMLDFQPSPEMLGGMRQKGFPPVQEAKRDESLYWNIFVCTKVWDI